MPTADYGSCERSALSLRSARLSSSSGRRCGTIGGTLITARWLCLLCGSGWRRLAGGQHNARMGTRSVKRRDVGCPAGKAGALVDVALVGNLTGVKLRGIAEQHEPFDPTGGPGSLVEGGQRFSEVSAHPPVIEQGWARAIGLVG